MDFGPRGHWTDSVITYRKLPTYHTWKIMDICLTTYLIFSTYLVFEWPLYPLAEWDKILFWRRNFFFLGGKGCCCTKFFLGCLRQELWASELDVEKRLVKQLIPKRIQRWWCWNTSHEQRDFKIAWEFSLLKRDLNFQRSTKKILIQNVSSSKDSRFGHF